jgi:hypothetical protein
MKTKADYKVALQVVGVVIREWDPYALIATGCPEDEFAAEIASVVAQVPRIKSPQDAAHAISRVFSSAFQPEGFTPENCAEAGSKLFGALSDNGLVKPSCPSPR